MRTLARCAVLGAAVLTGFLGTGTAQAAITATAGRTLPTPPAGTSTTITASAVMQNSAGTPYVGQPYSISYTSLSRTYAYPSVRNNGTIDMVRATFTITSGGIPLAGAALDVCSTAWNTSTATCPGTSYTAVSGTPVGLPLSIGAVVPLRLTLPAGLFTTVSVSVSVDRNSYRTAIQVNS
ncbi:MULTISPECIES: hypothetical protein [Actinosynnema]|uniref:hypothetical protein n=1 Tax=Actinosynnema TaxID=40566 RepID=UPI0020A4CF2B|nr:hypothetical protein [Actinosynnema pretiosum]MCP2097080.1 hypothetical protein [Actinosynnema pretiosum]